MTEPDVDVEDWEAALRGSVPEDMTWVPETYIQGALRELDSVRQRLADLTRDTALLQDVSGQVSAQNGEVKAGNHAYAEQKAQLCRENEYLRAEVLRVDPKHPLAESLAERAPGAVVSPETVARLMAKTRSLPPPVPTKADVDLYVSQLLSLGATPEQVERLAGRLQRRYGGGDDVQP